MPRRRLLTTQQAADELGIARRTLSRYAADGILTPTLTLPSGHYRWDMEDLRRQIREATRDNDPGS